MKNVPIRTGLDAALESFRSHTNPFLGYDLSRTFYVPLGETANRWSIWVHSDFGARSPHRRRRKILRLYENTGFAPHLEMYPRIGLTHTQDCGRRPALSPAQHIR